MENSPSSSLSSDLSRLKTRDEVIRFISSSLSSIDADCALHNSPLKIDESIDLLLRIDATVATMTAELDVQILQQTWRRLIAFFKSYHMFITSAQVDRVSKVLNIRACYFVNVLCIEGAAEKSCTFSREKQQQNYTSMVLNLQSLSFYCQRISASMAYFSMQYDEDSYQISMEILFFFRGYLSYFPSNPAIITRSEEFFWKALRSPFTATHDITNTLSEESKNSIEKSSSSGKRKRDVSITDGDIKSYPCNTSSSASSPFKKFDRAVRNLGRLCCSTLHPECKEGSIRDITGYCLSLGCSYLASYELEKRTKEHSDSSSDPTRRPSDASDVIDEMQRGHDHSQAVLILLNVFVSAIQKIVISYNCVGSDLAVTAASKHFQNTFLCCLTSINELVKIEVTGTGTGAGARVGTGAGAGAGAGAGTGTGTGSSYVNVIIGGVLAQSCNGCIKNKIKSRIARYLLCKILESMSSGSQIRIAESLWGVYSTITSLRKRKRAGCTDRRDSPDAATSDHSGHLLCVALTMRQFLCTARLDAVHTLLLKVMLSFDSCLAPSRTITSEQLAADENRDDDTEEDDDRVCLEPILRVLPLSALTARCRETIGFTARKSDSKDTHLPGQRSSENDLSSSRLVLALLGRLVGDACALLGADERSSAVTTCNDIQVSSYGTAIGVTVLAAVSGSHSGSTKSAQHNNGMRSVMSSLNFNTHASASLTHSLIRRIGVISKYLLGTRSNIDRGPKRSPVKVWDLRKVGCLIGAQQGLTISLHAALGSCAKGNNSLSMPKSQSDRDHLDSSNAGRPRPFHAEAEVKVLMSSALAMLAVADYLSTSPSFSQMLSPSNPRLAAQPPSVTSTALKALKCTFQTLDLILSLSETVTRDRFEFAKSCFHSTIKAALNFSHTLHLGESRTPTTHAPCHPQERGARTPLRSPLLAMVDVAKMWSMILSFLVSFAKNLPSSLQSGAQSLVPQKALSLVQAASRGSTGSTLRIISNSSESSVPGSLVVLSGGTRSEVASELWDHSNPLSEYDEVKGFARDDGASLHNSDHDSKSRSIKKSKILDYKCAACSNPKMIGYAQDEAYFRILDSHVDNDLIESFDTMHQLGFGSCPLDSSFEGASVLCPTGPGPQGSGGCIPVLQGILVGDCCADEVSSSSVSCSPGGAAMPSKAHLKPTRANCHFALLVLPAVHQSAVSVSVSRQVDASGKSSDEPDLLHKIVLKSTGSVAFVQLGE